jgi:hypothetical protein
MATQFKYIKSDNTEGMVSATNAQEAMKLATDRLATSGVQAIQQAPTAPVIPVDSAMGAVQPLPRVDNRPLPTATTGSVQGAITTAAMPPVEPVKEDTTARGKMESLASKIFGGGQDVAAEREQLRIDAQTREKEAQARLLGNKLTARQREIQKGLEAIEANPRGQTEYALNAEINKYNRETARELADLSFSYNVALGDYQAAEKIVSERLSDIQAQRAQDIQAFNTLFSFVQNDMTESEKLQAQQAWQEKQSEKDFAQRKELMAYENTLKQADPLYRAQLLKAQRDAMGGGGEAPKVVKINGIDSVWNPTTGEFEPVSVKGGGSSEFALAGAKQNIENIDTLLNAGGMSTAVGTNILGRAPRGVLGTVGKIATVVGIPGLFKDAWKGVTGQTQDFIAGVEQLQSQLSLDSLINAKAQGATFGALSDTEMRILSASASKIGSYVVKNKAGQAVGYNTTEANFQKELNKINNFAKLDYLLKGGNLEDVGAIQTPDGAVYVKNFDGTLTKLR